MSSLQIDHGVLRTHAPKLFDQFHLLPPKTLQIYDLEYVRDGNIYTLTAVRLRKRVIIVSNIAPEEERYLNRYLRARRQPDPQ